MVNLSDMYDGKLQYAPAQSCRSFRAIGDVCGLGSRSGQERLRKSFISKNVDLSAGPHECVEAGAKSKLGAPLPSAYWSSGLIRSAFSGYLFFYLSNVSFNRRKRVRVSLRRIEFAPWMDAGPSRGSSSPKMGV